MAERGIWKGFARGRDWGRAVVGVLKAGGVFVGLGGEWGGESWRVQVAKENELHSGVVGAGFKESGLNSEVVGVDFNENGLHSEVAGAGFNKSRLHSGVVGAGFNESGLRTVGARFRFGVGRL